MFESPEHSHSDIGSVCICRLHISHFYDDVYVENPHLIDLAIIP